MKNYESKYPCIVCGKYANGMVTYHHLKTRKSHPELENEPSNMISVCQAHHNLFHAKGTNYMADTYPSFKAWLIANNWEFNEFLGRWMINPG